MNGSGHRTCQPVPRRTFAQVGSLSVRSGNTDRRARWRVSRYRSRVRGWEELPSPPDQVPRCAVEPIRIRGIRICEAISKYLAGIVDPAPPVLVIALELAWPQ